MPSDRLSPEGRSKLMSQIRSKDTKPEQIVRRLLHSMGFRFRLHKKDLPGTPDIVLPKYSTVVLVHGCFWHRHEGCKRAYNPKTRREFWSSKFSANIARDRMVERALADLGWNVIVVWECQTSKNRIDALKTELSLAIWGNEKSSEDS